MEELSTIFSNSKNRANLRRAMEEASHPIIPQMSIFLADLTFIEDGNPDDLNGMINFNKRYVRCKKYLIITDASLQSESGLSKSSNLLNLSTTFNHCLRFKCSWRKTLLLLIQTLSMTYQFSTSRLSRSKFFLDQTESTNLV